MNQRALPGLEVGKSVAWQPTRDFGLEHLGRFLPRAGRAYAARRNFDLGPGDRSNVSALSPLIRHRLILEEEVLRETLLRHSLDDAEKFVQEVVWRGYFKGWLEHHPAVWTRYCADRDRWIRSLETDEVLEGGYERAVFGRTGIECFDAWSKELVDTGYLHNHARMWFASLWVFTLDLPWQLGADFFLRHLLDGDPASNTLSWRWVGGLHTPGKTYLARPENIERFTQGRFHPGAEIAASAAPLWEPAPPVAAPLPAADDLDPALRFALLVSEEDCLPETLELPSPPAGVVGWNCTEARSPLPVGEPARKFAWGAVDDALMRSQASFGLGPDRCERVGMDDWPAWLAARGLRTIVSAHLPVGPTADAIRAHRDQWARAGIRLVQIRRRYDEWVWPRAQKGFFALKRKLPELLAELALV